ncbi:hypothetical protein ALQ56_200265 [Pseudomonas syringae pv. papulans]|nr:hypothetical protein ALQ56_200265 [Pseudomonas syringae pv. papulans]
MDLQITGSCLDEKYMQQQENHKHQHPERSNKSLLQQH